MGVESVRKIETGLERGRWLSRKLRNTVLMQQDDLLTPASEIVAAYSRVGIFSAFAYVYGGRVGPENRNGTRKGSVVVEKTEKHCAHAELMPSMACPL